MYNYIYDEIYISYLSFRTLVSGLIEVKIKELRIIKINGELFSIKKSRIIKESWQKTFFNWLNLKNGWSWFIDLKILK